MTRSSVSTVHYERNDEGLIGIYMTQVQPFDPTLGSRFRELAYAALETS